MEDHPLKIFKIYEAKVTKNNTQLVNTFPNYHVGENNPKRCEYRYILR